MEIISAIAELYASAAQTFALMWLLLAWFPRREWTRKWQIVCWYLAGLFLAHAMILPNLVQSVLRVLLDIFLACLLLDGRKGEKTLTILVMNIFMIIISVFETRIAHFITGIGTVELIIQGSGIPIRVIGIVNDTTLYLVIAYVLSKYVRGKLRLKREEFGIIGIFYGLFFLTAVLTIAVADLSNLPGQWQAAFLILDVLMLLANIAVLRLIGHMNAQNRYEMENTVLRMQIADQERYMTQAEKRYLEIRGLRHDMKRYFVTYQQLLRDGKYEMVLRDIESVLGEKLEPEQRQYTENQILNVVISEKAERCREDKIAFEANVRANDKMDMIEAGIVLSNLLDNAIEAEAHEDERNRRIKLQVSTEQEMLHVVVRNYISQSVLARNPKLKTTKQNREYHGLGLESVRAFVRQKGGELEILEEGEWFVVHLCVKCA